ncbi:MbtH family protein [Streptomyces albus subsp. chlorinus]|uniref:MbtH family protein n=1 Tax=Streptomyces albus TaxID=1888 RepID=UPI00191DC7EF|nr:MbtH family protein [Streptomyces albus]
MAAFLGDDDTVACVVVINDAGQYSIWPADMDVPAGWHGTGFSGSRAACLTHIDETWTDPVALHT